MKRIRMFQNLLLLAVVVLSTALSGCSGKKTKDNEDHNSQRETTQEGVMKDPIMGGSMTVGIPQDIDSLDPHHADGAGTKEILFNIYEGLVKPDEKGDLKPAVASDYEISEDGKIYTFQLRD
ncbi:MAG TPA: ABC transporter substrate-binding protein, partial [Candidatus Merdenecus merdavium]|nr:ABC transporter substrate-binding protein [Candidatus Merdenecus merdavium]